MCSFVENILKLSLHLSCEWRKIKEVHWECEPGQNLGIDSWIMKDWWVLTEKKTHNYNTIIKRNKTKPKYGQDDPHSISLVGSLFKDLRLTWPAWPWHRTAGSNNSSFGPSLGLKDFQSVIPETSFIIYYPMLKHWRRKWQPTPVLLPGESLRQRGLVDHSWWVVHGGYRVRHDWATDTHTHLKIISLTHL